jgi:hypothetical protein
VARYGLGLVLSLCNECGIVSRFFQARLKVERHCFLRLEVFCHIPSMQFDCHRFLLSFPQAKTALLAHAANLPDNALSSTSTFV